jgi:deazaflavin-dependent oxidoreductase (nitroreductase family)
VTELPADIREHNRKLVEEFRAAGRQLGDRLVLLLTTTGARTGRTHTTPMMYVPDGDRVLVIASNAGAPRHPDWYRNLLAHPEVTVEVAGEEYPATALPLRGDEYGDRWQMITSRYPFFVEHQAGVRRQIPVVALVRRDR